MSSKDPGRAVLSRLGAGCLALGFVAEMVVLARAGHALPGIPILAALGAPFALFAVCGLSRLSIEDRGVRVVNTRRTFLLRWNDIERFSLGRYGLLREVGIAELRDGRRVGIWGIQGPNAVRRRSTVSAKRLIGAMNAELARRRPAAEPEVAQRTAGAAATPSQSKRVRVPAANASSAPPVGRPQAA